MRIFLSHSHQDNNWCSAFVEEIKRYGADVWYDKQGLYVGAKWRQTIETELEGRDIFLLVLTPNSWSSDWVQDELTLAMNHKKRIVSILHQPTQINGFITTRQMLKVIGLSSVEAARSVAAGLGLARVEQPNPPMKSVVEKPVEPPALLKQSPSPPSPKPSPSAGAQLPDEAYEYFEITVYQHKFGFDRFQITNTNTGQVFYRPKWWNNIASTKESSKATQQFFMEIKEVARANGLEELPETGAHWYSLRFRRKKQ